MASQLWRWHLLLYFTDKWQDFIESCTKCSFYFATLRIHGWHSIIKPCWSVGHCHFNDRTFYLGGRLWGEKSWNKCRTACTFLCTINTQLLALFVIVALRSVNKFSWPGQRVAISPLWKFPSCNLFVTHWSEIRKRHQLKYPASTISPKLSQLTEITVRSSCVHRSFTIHSLFVFSQSLLKVSEKEDYI
jgi:hypothetical protein